MSTYRVTEHGHEVWRGEAESADDAIRLAYDGITDADCGDLSREDMIAGASAIILEDEREGGACPDCGTPAALRTCDTCDTSAWIIDCGHYAQPRPIAAGRADGSDLHHTYCEDCSCGCCGVVPVADSERLRGDDARLDSTASPYELVR